jgi:hypothetical protein
MVMGLVFSAVLDSIFYGAKFLVCIYYFKISFQIPGGAMRFYCFNYQTFSCYIREAELNDVAESYWNPDREEWIGLTYEELLGNNVFQSLEDWKFARNEMLEEEIAELEDRVKQLKEFQNSEPQIFGEKNDTDN